MVRLLQQIVCEKKFEDEETHKPKRVARSEMNIWKCGVWFILKLAANTETPAF